MQALLAYRRRHPLQEIKKIKIYTMEREMASVIGQNAKENLYAFIKRMNHPVEEHWEKEVLAAALRDLVVERPEYLLYIYDKECLEFLLRLWESEELELTRAEWSMLGQLRLLGIVDYGYPERAKQEIDSIYLTEEAREHFYFYLKSKSTRHFMNKYEDWESILRGMMSFYGILSFSRLYFYFCKVCQEPVDDEVLHLFLSVRLSLLSFGSFAVEKGSQTEYYQNYEISNPEKVLDYRTEEQRMEYYLPSYDTLYFIGNNNGLGEWEGVHRLADLLMNELGTEYYKTVVVIKSCVLMLQNGETLEDTLAQFTQWCPESDGYEVEIKKAVRQLYDTVPIYRLKGWSREKLRQKDQKHHYAFRVIQGGKSDSKGGITD